MVSPVQAEADKLGRREFSEELRHCQKLPVSYQVVDAFVASPMVVFVAVHGRIVVRIEIPDGDGPECRPERKGAIIIIPGLDDELRPLLEYSSPRDHGDTVRPLVEWPFRVWRWTAQDPKAAWHDEGQCSASSHTYEVIQKQ